MQIRKGGQVHNYLRRKVAGKVTLTPLPKGPTDTPEFLAAYAAARGQRTATLPGSLADLIRRAQSSARMARLSPAYRAGLAREFSEIGKDRRADVRAATIEARHIRADMAEARAPALRLKAWRFLGDTAVDAGIWPDNRAAAVRLPQGAKVQGHAPWSAADIAAFRDRWPIGTVPRAAMELLFWTGARISDAVRIGRGNVDGSGVLTYTQQKTGAAAYCPWSCALPDYAEAMAQDRAAMHDALDCLPAQMVFLPTTQGARRSSKALGTMIRESARAAGIDRTAHGLRKSRAIALAEAGATTHQIAAWTGHHTLKEVAHYTQAADRRRAVMGNESANPIAKGANRAEK